MPRYRLELSNRQTFVTLTPAFLRSVFRRTMASESVVSAEVSLALVDDAEIHRVNREHLQHNCPTDVISFLYSSEPPRAKVTQRPNRSRICLAKTNGPGRGLHLVGEIVISGQTALREAKHRKLAPQTELTLYLIHGLLHLCGYDDRTVNDRELMQSREKAILALWGWSRE